MDIFAEIKDNEIEETLKKNLHIEFYKNNPSYIKLWQRYYEIKKDPKILFFMMHFGISKDYHWIYIELANHFKKLKYFELSYYVLSEAKRKNVFDAFEIEKEINNYSFDTKRFSDTEMKRILYPKRIYFWDTEWSINEILYCNLDNCFYKKNGEISFVSFEENRYLNGWWQKSENDLNFLEIKKFESEIENSYKYEDKDVKNFNKLRIETTDFENTKEELILQSKAVENQSNKNNSGVEQLNDSGKINKFLSEDEININNLIFQIKKRINNQKFIIFCLTETNNLEQSTEIKNYILEEIDEKYLKNIFKFTNNIFPTDLQSIVIAEKYFIKYTFSYETSVSEILNCYQEKKNVNEYIIGFYWVQILKLLIELKEQNLAIKELSLSDIMIENDLFSFKICNFKVENTCFENKNDFYENYKFFEDLNSFGDLKIFQFLNEYKNYDYLEFSIKIENILNNCDIKDILNEQLIFFYESINNEI
ncbi:Mad3/BUB1 domain-containing protein [Hamiltosporidium tvaerminnensis]|uniref:Mad3/BUB1 domain-containing protein n=2 Tax=Hamiltosporidium tvaerminnensis TaxID=1176355 RepID=A0A4Q9L2Z8_9MICR|nr:Mad3/BUB1 domain-containing protein [Hamiltosporidium tvaerminnensis]